MALRVKEKEEQTEEAQIQKISLLSFGEPFSKHENLNGVDVYLRTLFDGEVKDANHRGMLTTSPLEQIFEIDRWKLAYSLIAIGGKELPKDVEEKRGLIDTWLNVYVNMLLVLLETLNEEELQLVDKLKKFSGITEPLNTSN